MAEPTQKETKYIVIDNESRTVYSGYKDRSGNLEHSTDYIDVPYLFSTVEELKAFLLKEKTIRSRKLFATTPVSYKKEISIKLE